MNHNRFEYLEIEERQCSDLSAVSHNLNTTDVVQRDPSAAGQLRSPDGVALAQVTAQDLSGYQAQPDRVDECSAPSITGLRVIEVIGSPGMRAGQFNFPTGIALDREGILFVADSYNHRVQRVTPGGGVAVIGSRGSGKGQFLSPQGIATDEKSSFYIVEQGNHRVQKYSAGGELEMIIGRLGEREGEFRGPTSITVAPGSGDIYVSDTGNARIQRFDPHGQFMSMLGIAKIRGHSLAHPHGIAVDEFDNLSVIDTATRTIAQFDPIGRFKRSIYGTRDGDSPSSLREFRNPRNIVHARPGQNTGPIVYVSDERSTEIESNGKYGCLLAFDGFTGRIIAQVDDIGRGLGSLSLASGLAVGHSGTCDEGGTSRRDVFVSDTMNHRILRFAWN